MGLFNNSAFKNWQNRLLSLFQSSTLDVQKLEECLFEADFSYAMVEHLVSHVQKSKPNNIEEAKASMKECLIDMILKAKLESKAIESKDAILLLGVNGVGKTTTVARLAFYFQNQGFKVLLAALDTFRAGAIDQLKLWGQKLAVQVVFKNPGDDPASVAYEAAQKASQDQLLLILDTAGRMHTKAPLMEELKKIKKVLLSNGSFQNIHQWLVLDASVGQNAFLQAKEFHQCMQLTGLVLTKLDSTSKGGAVLSMALELKVPIVFIGVGEKAQDLEVFNPSKFVASLLS